MRSIFFAALLAVAVATPVYDSPEKVEVVKDDRVYPSAAGEYSLDLALDDGTYVSESGYGSGPDGAVESQGTVKFVHPDGSDFELKYVANAEGGYQPESDALPVAPEFPHPIPQFVLDQIAFAASQKESSEEYQRSYAPSQKLKARYGVV